MNTKKLYTVEELKKMGTVLDTSSIMEKQLSFFNPKDERFKGNPVNPIPKEETEVKAEKERILPGQISLFSLPQRTLAYAYSDKKRNR